MEGAPVAVPPVVTSFDPELLIYIVPLGVIFLFYLGRRARHHRQSSAVFEDNQQAGLLEPASLHPHIDEAQCIGCAACVSACPERKHEVLGVIHGKAQLINPTACIGHGACKAACPVDAITLVFGTETRGVDIPNVKPNFETNVPGIFVAGELGGMGLIGNAVEQGRQAMDSVARLAGKGGGTDVMDVVIVGAGPAGFSASLAAMQKKLRYVTVEQDSLGGTVYNFPRGKLVMTRPVDLPVVGKVRFSEVSKEKLLQFWQKVEKDTGVKIRYKERVEDITTVKGGFVVKTTRGEYKTRAVLLAIGRRGTPRKLGVPGEELPKVTYRMIDPEQYKGRHVLVVGGGDSALEAATSIADQPGSTVTLSYRSEAFGRAKAKNRERLDQATAEGRLQVMLKSTVKEITPEQVTLEMDGKAIPIPNDGIIVCAGGILPTGFLKQVGIQVETKYGTR
ncbi:MAG: NAD(P)-binding domain-containing protein [Nitrospirota bacterium]|nr:NAD(P)-binding domain-containing protein [Nitrospirota bacterium]